MPRIASFIRETFVYGFGNVFSRLFAMFLIPLYARYLGKIDYSNLVMLQSTFTILTFLTALNAGVFFYYYEYDNQKYRKIVLTSWFYYQLVVTILLSISLFFASPLLFRLFVVDSTNATTLQWSLVLVGVQLFPYIFNNTNINFFRIERKPKPAVVIVLLEACFTLVTVYLSLAVFELGLLGVLSAQIISRTVVTLFYVKIAKTYVLIQSFSKKLLHKIFMYAWPFILSSIFTWVIISIDKFIGAYALVNKEDVALLALSMQLVLPVSVLSDMIRMAVGPYVMSIRKESDAEKSYQQIFELTIFATALVIVGIVAVSPLLTLLLADATYINVIYVIPLMAFASIFSLAGNQFCISFSLIKKNIYILYGVMIAGIIGFFINTLFMHQYGFIVSGISQILSYAAMATFLYFFGRKVADLKIKLRNSFLLATILLLYIFVAYFLGARVADGDYFWFFSISILTGVLLTIIYLQQQKLKIRTILEYVKGRNS
jgi:O-antigen/teichoic acid export membrane protein